MGVLLASFPTAKLLPAPQPFHTVLFIKKLLRALPLRGVGNNAAPPCGGGNKHLGPLLQEALSIPSCLLIYSIIYISKNPGVFMLAFVLSSNSTLLILLPKSFQLWPLGVSLVCSYVTLCTAIILCFLSIFLSFITQDTAESSHMSIFPAPVLE